LTEQCGYNMVNEKNRGSRDITCDQVVWILDVFDRYLPPSDKVRVSREREMLMYGMLYEIMEVAGLKFEDDSARWNGTPNDCRPYTEED